MFFTEADVSYIQSRACERITEVLDALGIEYTEKYDYIQMPCPVHGGDNSRGMFWAMKSNHWECKTRYCHEDPVTGPSSSIFGMVRGTITRTTGLQCSFRNAVSFVSQALNLSLNNKSIEQDIEITKLIKRHKKYRKQDKHNGVLLSDILQTLVPDTIYFPNRCVSKELIARYHISYCNNPKKPFYNRAFFPVLDETGRYVLGWSGRSIYEQCSNCGMYHDPNKHTCPDIRYRGVYTKWKHSINFKASECLYNCWYAKPFVAKTGTVILCEGPGDVWGYESAGIRNSVALLGLTVSKKQRLLLQNIGALTVICTLDNDVAGLQASKRIKDQLQNHFRVFCVTPDIANDIGDMFPEDITKQIDPILKQVSRAGILKG